MPRVTTQVDFEELLLPAPSVVATTTTPPSSTTAAAVTTTEEGKNTFPATPAFTLFSKNAFPSSKPSNKLFLFLKSGEYNDEEISMENNK